MSISSHGEGLPLRAVVTLVCAGTLASLGRPQTLGPMQSYQATPPSLSVFHSAAGDLDHDGDVDLVVTDGNFLNVLLGDGTGSLTWVAARPGLILANFVRLADLNRDGHLDAVVDTFGGPRLLVGDGAGGFAFFAALSGNHANVQVGDFDGDGNPDVVTASATDLLLYRSYGGGGFAPAAATPLAGFSIVVHAARDMDGDGAVDVLATVDLNRAVVLWGDGRGGFPTRTSVGLPVWGLAGTVGDLDGDGLLDCCITGLQSSSVMVLRASAPRSFAPPVVIGLPGEAGAAVMADADGDGRLDLALGLPSQTLILPGNGAGGLGPARVFVGGGSLTLTDLDGDGRVDVIGAGAAIGQVGVRRNATPALPGLLPYGIGTPACAGTIGIAGSRVPSAGAADFRILASNVPPGRPGLVAFGQQHTAGADPLGLGLRLHLQLASIVGVSGLASDVGGVASYPQPIPASGGLIGAQVSAQTFWIGDAGAGNTCSPAWFELASSRGLHITVQP